MQGRSAVVTGATGFFGAVFADTLLAAGARVAVFGRGTKLESLRRDLAERHDSDRVLAFEADLHQDDAFRSALARAGEALGGVDVLVNNAFEFSRETGFNDPSGALERIGKDQWLRALESGIYWHAAAIQVLIEGMRERRRGSIVNVGSMYGKVSPDPALYRGRKAFNPPTYAAAKAGLVGLTRYVASFYGEHGVRCNALVPGAFPNVAPDAYNNPGDDAFIADLARRTLLGRVGRVDDLRGALLFLASDASAYVTGQELVVDGGWTVR
jgi:NAD(P)-dependent dehydrogenase (short-subunit alcohol dehydrogenase family)